MTAFPLKREEWWVWGMALKATSSNFCPTEINLRATFVVRSLAGNAGVWDQHKWSVWLSSFVQGLPLLVEFPMAHSIILLASHLSLSEVLTQLFTSCCILEYMQEQRSPVVYWDRVACIDGVHESITHTCCYTDVIGSILIMKFTEGRSSACWALKLI